MLKLKLQYFGHLMQRVDSLEKTLMLGGIGGAGGEGDNRGWDGWMASPTGWTWVWVNSGSWWWTVVCCDNSWSCKELDTTERLNWTEPTLGTLSLIDKSQSGRCTEVSHCIFYLHFLNHSWCWASFSYIYWPWNVSKFLPQWFFFTNLSFFYGVVTLLYILWM